MNSPTTSTNAVVVKYVPASDLRPGDQIKTGEEIVHAAPSARNAALVFVSVIDARGAIRGFEVQPEKPFRVARPRARAVLKRSAR